MDFPVINVHISGCLSTLLSALSCSLSLSPCQLINSTRIIILPLINPDGRQLAEERQCTSTRGMANIRGKDLDTDFFGQLYETL